MPCHTTPATITKEAEEEEKEEELLRELTNKKITIMVNREVC